jgi:hypothetical protein
MINISGIPRMPQIIDVPVRRLNMSTGEALAKTDHEGLACISKHA